VVDQGFFKGRHMDRGAEGMRCGEGVGFPLFHRREIWGGGCAAPQKKK